MELDSHDCAHTILYSVDKQEAGAQQGASSLWHAARACDAHARLPGALSHHCEALVDSAKSWMLGDVGLTS